MNLKQVEKEKKIAEIGISSNQQSNSELSIQNQSISLNISDENVTSDDILDESFALRQLFNADNETRVASQYFKRDFPSSEGGIGLNRKPKLGVIFGVYLPTIQHIFGVLMFIRMAWMVGHGGIYQTWLMVFLCCCATFTTAISISAIATNGIVRDGGPYFMISRNMGSQVGGTIGMCFYLANTFAINLYVLGGIEILLTHLAPSLAIFGDMHENPENNMRFYGSIIIILMAVVVGFGVRFVQMLAPVSLICVVVAIASVFAGAFGTISKGYSEPRICLVGDRLLNIKVGEKCNLSQIEQVS
ncbi:DgyrCDS1873 [Dimorphilus gyrociliatus]|uniref:DgyrCDS1873 n=1 Tax=Dimorphilus gyrociliatus TaxID=2664684 RepID=A0A7I8VDQ2_9ANNE|nr:DgyrCDS1873 [Dimorphilus gyrociliatus]